MNLIAKEFCASRVDGEGILVLSEFAGAAKELDVGALLVNPYDAEGVAAALYRAFRMSGDEQRVRMHKMREWIQRHDVFGWYESFCSQAVPSRLKTKQPLAEILFQPRWMTAAATQVSRAGFVSVK